EILRFDPSSGSVDRRISIGGSPEFARWFGGRLFVSNDRAELYEIDSEGHVIAIHRGSLKGDGLGYLWLWDPSDGSIHSMAPNGLFGEIAIPGSGPIAGDLSRVRSVGEAGGYLWLIFGDHSTSVVRFDVTSGELLPFPVGRWIHSMVEHDGALWLASHSDHLLIRVDPESGEVHRYPVPGKPGGLLTSNGDLWVALFHPGQLVRISTTEDLIETPVEVVGSVEVNVPGQAHLLSCTLGGVSDETLQRATADGDFSELGPTLLLEPNPWLDYGVWSVVQAELSNAGHVVCTHGYLDGEGSPEQRAADLETSLKANGIPGPYVLIGAADGVHALRFFADGREDIVGVVLVDPMPIGFGSFHDVLVAGGGHPPWADLDPATAATLTGFGKIPLVVLAQDPSLLFRHPDYIAAVGAEAAEAENRYWQEGLTFYSGLSTDSRTVVATGSALERIIWDRPDLVIDAVLSLIPDR
ncbi:MAG: hypothetical protein R3246_11575, partial [Acidimicrobiia bacterium]|nr:hypothetical protein [Acidimicrobiia bacterium]